MHLTHNQAELVKQSVTAIAQLIADTRARTLLALLAGSIDGMMITNDQSETSPDGSPDPSA